VNDKPISFELYCALWDGGTYRVSRPNYLHNAEHRTVVELEPVLDLLAASMTVETPPEILDFLREHGRLEETADDTGYAVGDRVRYFERTGTVHEVLNSGKMLIEWDGWPRVPSGGPYSPHEISRLPSLGRPATRSRTRVVR
jgi:hypothetical protein